MTGRNVEISQLHPFGCRVFAKSMKNPESKFDPKAEDFIFLNYDPRAKAFRVRSKGTSQVLVRSQRDLSFNDLEFPAWKNFNVKRDLGISFDISLYKAPTTQRPQQVVMADQKEEEKCPETLLIILDENRHRRSDESGPSYTSEFQRDIALNPRSGTRSGRRFSSHDILVSFIEELSPDQLAFHNENESCNEIAVDEEVKHHIELMTEKVTPTDMQSAMEIPDFKKAIDEELKTINDFHTFDLVPRSVVPAGVKTFRPIWRFRYKADGRAKARLCFPGHKQLYGVNFTDTQSPTLQMTSFWLFLLIVHLRNAQIRHLDVKNAYLHALVNEEVYMEQPTGFVDPDRPDHVCKMNRALYRMKQAG